MKTDSCDWLAQWHKKYMYGISALGTHVLSSYKSASGLWSTRTRRTISVTHFHTAFTALPQQFNWKGGNVNRRNDLDEMGLICSDKSQNQKYVCRTVVLHLQLHSPFQIESYACFIYNFNHVGILHK